MLTTVVKQTLRTVGADHGEGRPMGASPVLMSVFTLALLLPVMYGRYRRRSGATPAGLGTRRGRVLVMGMASIVLVGVLGGAAMAANGDKDGSQTGTQAPNLIPHSGKASQHWA